MRTIATTDFSPQTKIFLYLTITSSTILALWDGISNWNTNTTEHFYLIDVPLFIGSITGLVYLTRHKLLLTESALWQYGFASKHIELNAIDGIVEHLGSYIITSGKISIRITTDLQDKDLFHNQVVSRVQEIDLEQNPLPGRRLNDLEQVRLFEQLHHMLRKGEQDNTIFHADTAIIDELSDASYYLMYEHPVHGFLHRAYYTDLSSLQAFLTDVVMKSRERRFTIAILPLSVEWLIICNHQGAIFFQRDQ